jgi:hypothetical protein
LTEFGKKFTFPNASVMLDLAMVFDGGCVIMELDYAGHFVQEWATTLHNVAQRCTTSTAHVQVLDQKKHRADVVLDRERRATKL